MQSTYLFYDIETSGLSKCFDQVFQFAAIRTDMQLNELERHEILVHLNPDIIPAPLATITHHIGLKDTETGLCEYEAMQKIHALMNTPGTISLGYNTLAFDDEFLRFSFYRNLLTPYTHQYANQCQRMDIYPMTLFFHLFKPEALEHWPTIKGRHSMKLEMLSDANNLATGQAHDAMVDVEATLALAKHWQQHDKMWDYLCGYFNKRIDQTRCQGLPVAMESATHNHHEGVMILGRIGARYKYLAPVLSLGPHQTYKNQSLWLRLDLPELRQCTLDNADEHTWVLNKKFGEPGFLLPPTSHYQKPIKPERLEEVQRNKVWLAEHPDILRAICEHYCQYTYPYVAEADVDTALYQKGFLSDQDQRQAKRFHQASLQEKPACADAFDDPDLREIAIRVLGRNYPEQLEPAQKIEYDSYLQQALCRDKESALIDYTRQPRFTLEDFWAQVDEAKQRDLSNAQQLLLQELEQKFSTT